MRKSIMKALPADIQADLLTVNELLYNALCNTQSNLSPSERLEMIKSDLIEAMKKLPVNNYSLIAPYC
jgi:hypothetical protein